MYLVGTSPASYNTSYIYWVTRQAQGFLGATGVASKQGSWVQGGIHSVPYLFSRLLVSDLICRALGVAEYDDHTLC